MLYFFIIIILEKKALLTTKIHILKMLLIFYMNLRIRTPSLYAGYALCIFIYQVYH